MLKNENKHVGEYLLAFIEEFWEGQDPKYDNWANGRVEVHTYEDRYAISEIRFCTPRNDEWIEFRKEYDGKWVDKATLDRISQALEEKFYINPPSSETDI